MSIANRLAIELIMAEEIGFLERGRILDSLSRPMRDSATVELCARLAENDSAKALRYLDSMQSPSARLGGLLAVADRCGDVSLKKRSLSSALEVARLLPQPWEWRSLLAGLLDGLISVEEASAAERFCTQIVAAEPGDGGKDEWKRRILQLDLRLHLASGPRQGQDQMVQGVIAFVESQGEARALLTLSRVLARHGLCSEALRTASMIDRAAADGLIAADEALLAVASQMADRGDHRGAHRVAAVMSESSDLRDSAYRYMAECLTQGNDLHKAVECARRIDGPLLRSTTLLVIVVAVFDAGHLGFAEAIARSRHVRIESSSTVFDYSKPETWISDFEAINSAALTQSRSEALVSAAMQVCLRLDAEAVSSDGFVHGLSLLRPEYLRIVTRVHALMHGTSTTVRWLESIAGIEGGPASPWGYLGAAEGGVLRKN